MENKLELRMYGFVNYQLTGIQMGIQFAHSIVEYGLEYFHTNEYLDWAKYWKTVILLNGGTTNNTPDKLGTLNQTYNTLLENGIVCSSFSEPDLGDQMTAISFIVDERVFNREKYLDLGDWISENGIQMKNPFLDSRKIDKMRLNGYFDLTKDQEEIDLYQKWIEHIGGIKNVFLRDFLKNKKLA